MLIVPLLVGIAILTVAMVARIERAERASAVGAPVDTTLPPPGEADSPLRAAFPLLRFWVPSDELLGRPTNSESDVGTCALPGSIGPDIIVGRWEETQKQHEDAYADAA